jgi:ribosomal protein S18 acetylase RimI-like enzyme
MCLVSPATPAELPAAVRLLTSRRPAVSADRLLALFADGECSPDGLLVTRADGALTGAVLVQLQPGSSAVVHPPAADNPALADALAVAAVEQLRAAGVRQAQCVVHPPDVPLVAPLERAGFRPVTRLVFFALKLDKSLRVGPNPASGRLQFERVADPSAEFAAALMASYDGTRDCPELNDLRSADEILAGYRSMAESPDWTLLRLGGEPVGVLILGAGPKPGVAELTYVGLAPGARGRGLGELAVRYALRQRLAAGDGWLTLSTDERNGPAVRLYGRLGFRRFDVQHVFIWSPTRGQPGA